MRRLRHRADQCCDRPESLWRQDQSDRLALGLLLSIEAHRIYYLQLRISLLRPGVRALVC